MGINLHDICYVIQFEISDYKMLPELFQQLGCKEKNVVIM